jgi:translation initiation factor IF-1
MERPIETEGKIVAVLPGTMFRVALANEHLVLAHISGKMRKRFIRLTTGDLVKLEISPTISTRHASCTGFVSNMVAWRDCRNLLQIVHPSRGEHVIPHMEGVRAEALGQTKLALDDLVNQLYAGR